MFDDLEIELEIHTVPSYSVTLIMMNTSTGSSFQNEGIDNAKESLRILQEYNGPTQNSIATEPVGGMNPFIAYSLLSILVSGSVLLIFYLRKKLIS